MITIMTNDMLIFIKKAWIRNEIRAQNMIYFSSHSNFKPDAATSHTYKQGLASVAAWLGPTVA